MQKYSFPTQGLTRLELDWSGHDSNGNPVLTITIGEGKVLDTLIALSQEAGLLDNDGKWVKGVTLYDKVVWIERCCKLLHVDQPWRWASHRWPELNPSSLRQAKQWTEKQLGKAPRGNKIDEIFAKLEAKLAE